MDSKEFLESIATDVDAVVEVLETGDLEVTVRACPEWSLADLTFHLGRVYRFWADVIGELREARPELEIDRPADEDLASWLEDGAEELLDVLEQADDAARCWTWWGSDHVVRMKRRMALESAVHRWDAQSTLGETSPIDASLAGEGIREFIDIFLPATDEPWPHEHATIHLHRTDGRGNWQFTLDPSGGEMRWARDDAAIVRASASDLLLLLWGRISPDDVTITGQADVVRHLVDYVDLT